MWKTICEGLTPASTRWLCDSERGSGGGGERRRGAMMVYFMVMKVRDGDGMAAGSGDDIDDTVV